MDVHQKAFKLLLCSCLLLYGWSFAFTAAAETQPALQSDRLQQLQQKQLTIDELAKELARLNEQIAQNTLMIERSSRAQRAAEQKMAGQKEKIGRILRNQYTRNNLSVLQAAVRTKSLSAALKLIVTLRMMIRADQRTLDEYAKDVKAKQQAKAQLLELKQKLQRNKQSILLQQSRLLVLQQQLSAEMPEDETYDLVARQLSRTSRLWQTTGLPLVESYMVAIDKAMADFPEMLQLSKQSLSLKALRYRIRITDADLNAFLQSKNSIFKHLIFRFEQQRLVAEGSTDGISLRLEGIYSIIDKPQNGLKFELQKLTFNGLELPDTTRNDFANRFDLGFYPQLVFKMLRATKVELEDGAIVVELKIAF